MSYITTYTRNHFNPVHPEAEKIDIQDIAHALSLTCICPFSGRPEPCREWGYCYGTACGRGSILTLSSWFAGKISPAIIQIISSSPDAASPVCGPAVRGSTPVRYRRYCA